MSDTDRQLTDAELLQTRGVLFACLYESWTLNKKVQTVGYGPAPKTEAELVSAIQEIKDEVERVSESLAGVLSHFIADIHGA